LKQEKTRLDLVLVERGLFASREKARAAVMTGRVLVNEDPVTKAGTLLSPSDQIRLRGEDPPFVSRGGIKLAKALQEFDLSIFGKVVLDIGASTGGFTDCLLQKGAASVIAIDVGYGQLAWSLRQDPRVICLERTNIRYVKPLDIPEKGEIATIDLSFISLEKVLPNLLHLLKPQAQIVALIKPQFEAGMEYVGKNGVVKDAQVHFTVLQRVITYGQKLNLVFQGLTHSPLLGPKGNIEFFVWFGWDAQADGFANPTETWIKSIVNAAHHYFKVQVCPGRI